MLSRAAYFDFEGGRGGGRLRGRLLLLSVESRFPRDPCADEEEDDGKMGKLAISIGDANSEVFCMLDSVGETKFLLPALSLIPGLEGNRFGPSNEVTPFTASTTFLGICLSVLASVVVDWGDFCNLAEVFVASDSVAAEFSAPR